MTTEVRKQPTNVAMKVDKKKQKLVIEVDLKSYVNLEELPLATSGKSYTLATSHGFQKVQEKDFEGLSYSLNVITNKKEYDNKRAIVQQRELAKEIQAERLSKDAEVAKLRAELEEQKAMNAKILAMLEKLTGSKK